MNSKECGILIEQKKRMIDTLYLEINGIAKKHIPDFHFMNYKVSTFWECGFSPIGMCVFKLDDHGNKTVCRYCDGPVERK